MDRRALLKLLSAVALTGCTGTRQAEKPLRVVVVGAGIVGASIAYHLARAGAEVSVIDKQGPATHASRGTFAWINATWAKQPRHYHELSQISVSNWRSLQRALNLPVRWGGSLEWFESSERQNKLTQQITEQREWGEPARMINAREFAELEPEVRFNRNLQAALSPNDGTVDPVVATMKLLAAAKKLGAVVRFPGTLTDLGFVGGRLRSVVTSAGTINADRVVLATGAAPRVCTDFAKLDIPQRSTAGVIAITDPMPRMINRVVVAPGIHLHQRDDGRIVMGEQSGAPQNIRHDARLLNRPNEFPTKKLEQQHAQRMLTVAQKFVPAMRTAYVEQVYIGWRPLPLDGHPVIGASPERPDVYIAIMHSGVSLAPIVGQLTTLELLGNQQVARLEHYRPGRLFESIKRY